ncbi:MAG: hypothetical protein IT563_01110 [Alphaproteobacteria bacterium]|nr:hypothetical protein [Alphaproteobacteria bacterium]
MRKALPLLAGVGTGVVAALAATAVRADAIDGDWCGPDGRHLEIHGPRILTPGGNQHTGDYTRHSFAYVVPASEKDAGATVSMRLLNEEMVSITPRPGAPAETWLRCKSRPIS